MKGEAQRQTCVRNATQQIIPERSLVSAVGWNALHQVVTVEKAVRSDPGRWPPVAWLPKDLHVGETMQAFAVELNRDGDPVGIPAKQVPAQGVPAQGTILKHFKYEHLPESLARISRPICELATKMCSDLPDCAEKSAGLRKLLEAKDCFVRAGGGD